MAQIVDRRGEIVGADEARAGGSRLRRLRRREIEGLRQETVLVRGEL